LIDSSLTLKGLFSDVEAAEGKPVENTLVTGVDDGVPLNWNGALLVGAVDPAPKLNEDAPPNANVDGVEPNAGGGAAAVDDDENGKPLVVPAGAADVWIGLVVVFDVAPKVNDDDVLVAEPKAGNDETDVVGLSVVAGAIPNEAVAPNAGGAVPLLVEVTEGANGLSGLLAPNANGVLFDVVVVVVVVFPDGKLKPCDDDKPAPNKEAADVVAGFAVVTIDVDATGKLFGNENPLIVVETGHVKEEAVVVVGAVTLDEKANKFGVVDKTVVVAASDNDGATTRAEALVPNENKGGLSDETVEEAVVVTAVDNGVLPNDPNVIDFGTSIGDDDVVVVVVIIEGVVDVLVSVVVFADVNEPNDWNVEGVLVLIWKRLFGVLVTGLSKVAVVVPNKEVVVEWNAVLTVTGGLVIIFSFVVVAIVLNNGSAVVVVVENEAVVVASDGIEKVLSLVVVSDDVTIGVDSIGVDVWLVVTGVGTVGSIIIISGVSSEGEGVGSIALNRL
jgi:hypothetical protein